MPNPKYKASEITYPLSYYVDLRLGAYGENFSVSDAFSATVDAFGRDLASKARQACGETPQETKARD